ncbi:unnamed protein product [Polarella glacialis]|uniref:Glycosyltransferase family 92 protein n=1 Tax=Polarella glacialis TaxID=89957 RepID=A0A813DDM5_POLGL|nr:unnamed protein product [Polarella glacialis]
MSWARADGCEWLLHIDLDELFVAVDGRTAPQHFGSVPAEHNTVAYVNHEGVPEIPSTGAADYELRLARNRFEAVSLFRRNPCCFAEGFDLDELLAEAPLGASRGSVWQSRLEELAQAMDYECPELGYGARRAFAFWLLRTKKALGSAQYFLAYVNGKGAVRLRSPNLPNGVHRFGTTDLDQYWCPQEAAVFHYAHGSCEAVASKLRRLRASSGTWWRPFPLYDRGRGMDDRALEELYGNAVAICDAPETSRQLESSICLRHSVAHQHLLSHCLSMMD